MLPPLLSKLVRSLFVTFCFFISCGVTNAMTVILPSDDDLIIGARAIVRGKVIAISTALDPQQQTPYTYVTLDVSEVFKGDITTNEIVLKEQGGESGNTGSLLYGTPNFHMGEEVILYLDNWADGSLRVYQMFLGKFSVVKDSTSDRSLVTHDNITEKATIIGQSVSGAFTEQKELADYSAMVRGRLLANEERSRQFAAKYYSNTPVVMKPPEYTATLKNVTVMPQFNTMAPAACWFEASNNQSITFLLNNDGIPYPQISDDLAAALNAWSTAASPSLKLTSRTIASQCAPTAGTALLNFNNCDSRWSPSPSCAGVLAMTTTAYSTSQSRLINGRSFYKVTGATLSFNPYLSCQFLDHQRIQETITHEVGHSLGLAHSWIGTTNMPTSFEMDATMYPIIHFDERGSALHIDDVAGIRTIYPTSNLVSDLMISTGTPVATYILGSEDKRIFSAIGGTQPYRWTFANNSGPLPPGLFLTGDGELNGTASVVGKFTFTLLVIDANQRTATKTMTLEIIDAPLIKSLKYKANKRQLTITGERLSSLNMIFLDRVAISPTRISDDTIVIKRLDLASGNQEIRIKNAAGVYSNLALLEVR